MAHAIIAVDCPPLQHKRLVDAMNCRKYHFKAKREGYNIPHVSEIRFYNIRAKKDVMPHILNDLMVVNLFGVNSVSEGADGFSSMLTALDRNTTNSKIKRYLINKTFNLIRWFMAKFLRVYQTPKSNLPPKKFVEGWHHVYCVGTLKDYEGRFGEEL